jgi:HK97 family phage portal protein
MSLFDFFKKNPSESKSLTPQPILSKEADIIEASKWSDSKTMSQEDMISQYKSWSFVCARLNGESVASANIRLYAITKKGQGRIKNFDTKSINEKTLQRVRKQAHITAPIESIEEIYSHPALDLLYEVHEFSNYFDNMQMTSTYLDLTGNAYWYIVKDSIGTPVGIYQMRPDYTKIVQGKQKMIKGYIYGNNSDKSALKTDDVIRFYVPNPSSFLYGKSCIEAASAEVSRNNLYNVYENSNIKNNGRPDFVVKYDGQLTREDQKRLDYEWNRLYQGASNSHKIKIMDSNWSIDKLSFNPKDMEFLNGRVFTKKDLASMFGVPYGLLDTSDELKAGLDNVLSYYQRFAIKPRLRRIEESLNEQYIPLFDNSGSLFFAFDDPVDDDKQFKVNKNVAYVKHGIISINEAREDEGYDSVEGMDNLQVKVSDSKVELDNEETPI